MKNIIKKIKKNPEDTAIIIISIIALIIGALALGFLWAFIIVGIVDILLLVIPHLLKKNGKSKPKNETKKTPKKKKRTGLKILKAVLLTILILGIVGLIAGGILLYSIVKDIEEFDPNRLYEKEATIIYDKDNNEITKLGAEMREKITFDEMSEVLVDAIVATEDSRFFEHNGFDLLRFMKASAGQLMGNSGAGGASTLTMQVSKNQLTSTEASGWEGIKRKFSDIYLSIFEIEKQYTKKEIFEFYANSFYLGNGAYGVEQASLNYFNKHASELNLAEAAMIAGLFNAPVALDPYNNMEGAEERRKTVLYLMERHGYITEEEKKIAESMTIDTLLVNNTTEEQQYKSFIDTVVEEVIEKTGNNPYTVPMEIYTTMDRDKQEHIDKLLAGELDYYEWENEAVQAGISVIDVKDGSISAIGAGRNREGERTLNFATMLNNQIGSTAKPLYDYGPGIEYNNWNTYGPFADEPYAYSSGLEIDNWDYKFMGLMTMRNALMESRNIPAIKAFQSVNNAKIKEFVTNLGLSPEISGNIVHESHALGGYNGESPLTVSAAYAAFGNGGYYTEPYSFTKIIYRDTGEEYKNTIKTTRAMSEETAYMVADMLVTTAKDLFSNYPSLLNTTTFGAKSGTTNFSEATIKQYGLSNRAVNDLWITGVSSEYAISIWYGYEKINSEYYNVISSGQNYRIFNAVAKGIFENKTTFKKPDSVVEIEVEIDNPTATLPSEFTPDNLKTKELFKKGTEPTEVSTRFSKLENVTNLNSNIDGSTLTLTWDTVKTPDAINEEYITKLAKQMFTDEEYQESYVQNRLKYNRHNIGYLVYEVYEQDTSGNLNLIKTTVKNTVDIEITGSGSKTYVVKTSYSIFKDNMSDGTSTTVTFDIVESLITSELNGERTILLNIGDEYLEESVTVYDNGLVVTSEDLVITISGEVDTTQAGTYNISYMIKYNDYENILTRTVIVQ